MVFNILKKQLPYFTKQINVIYMKRFQVIYEGLHEHQVLEM